MAARPNKELAMLMAGSWTSEKSCPIARKTPDPHIKRMSNEKSRQAMDAHPQFGIGSSAPDLRLRVDIGVCIADLENKGSRF